MDLIKIVKNHDLTGLKENLKFSNINACDENKNSLLHLAIFNNDSDIANYLVLNSIDINRVNEAGNTPLHFSILYNRLAMFKLIIKSGANLNLQNKDLESPIMLAMRLGRELMVRILLEARASTNLKNKLNEGIEFYALYLKEELCLSFLKSSNPLGIENDHGETLLHRAAFLGNLEAAKYLCQFHFLVNKQNNNGETPLFLASRRENLEIIKLLLFNHCLLDIKNKYDEQVLDIASNKVSSYIEQRAYDFDYLDYLKKYALHVGVILNRLNDVKSLKTIIRKNKRDVYGYTPLDYAKFYNFKAIISELSQS